MLDIGGHVIAPPPTVEPLKTPLASHGRKRKVLAAQHNTKQNDMKQHSTVDNPVIQVSRKLI